MQVLRQVVTLFYRAKSKELFYEEISASVDGGLSGVSRVRGHGSEDPHRGPPDFGRTKAEMGRFSQKGLCYSIEILQGLLSNKFIRITMKNKFRGTPLPPQLTLV